MEHYFATTSSAFSHSPILRQTKEQSVHFQTSTLKWRVVHHLPSRSASDYLFMALFHTFPLFFIFNDRETVNGSLWYSKWWQSKMQGVNIFESYVSNRKVPKRAFTLLFLKTLLMKASFLADFLKLTAHFTLWNQTSSSFFQRATEHKGYLVDINSSQKSRLKWDDRLFVTNFSNTSKTFRWLNCPISTQVLINVFCFRKSSQSQF